MTLNGAAVANRPDLSSTGGFIFGLMNPEEVRQGFGKVNPITWRSGKLHRVARSSLSAETQALADLDGELMFARLMWSEMLGHRVDLKVKEQWIREVPAVMVIDARALYDALERGDLTIANMKDKYSALETLALAQNLSGQGTCLQWTDSLGQRMLTFELPGCLHECQETESLTGRTTFRCLKVLSLKALDFRLPFSGHVRAKLSM